MRVWLGVRDRRDPRATDDLGQHRLLRGAAGMGDGAAGEHGAVMPVNDPPLAAVQALTTAEDTGPGITLTGSDADGDALTFSVTTVPAHGLLSGAAPDLIYTPAANWHGADTFTFQASDGVAVSAAVEITIIVTPVNDAPVAASQSLTTVEDAALPLALTGSDADEDMLTWTIVSPPAHGALTGTAPDFVFVPDANYHGPDSFIFTVNDGQADTQNVP